MTAINAFFLCGLYIGDFLILLEDKALYLFCVHCDSLLYFLIASTFAANVIKAIN